MPAVRLPTRIYARIVNAGGCCPGWGMLPQLGDAVPSCGDTRGAAQEGAGGQDPHPHTNSDTRKKFGPGARARRGIARPRAAGRGGLENTSSFRSSTQAFKILSLFYFKKYRAGAPREVQTGGWRGHGAGPRGMAPGTGSRPGDTRGHPPIPPAPPGSHAAPGAAHPLACVPNLFIIILLFFKALKMCQTPNLNFFPGRGGGTARGGAGGEVPGPGWLQLLCGAGFLLPGIIQAVYSRGWGRAGAVLGISSPPELAGGPQRATEQIWRGLQLRGCAQRALCASPPSQRCKAPIRPSLLPAPS